MSGCVRAVCVASGISLTSSCRLGAFALYWCGAFAAFLVAIIVTVFVPIIIATLAHDLVFFFTSIAVDGFQFFGRQGRFNVFVHGQSLLDRGLR